MKIDDTENFKIEIYHDFVFLILRMGFISQWGNVLKINLNSLESKIDANTLIFLANYNSIFKTKHKLLGYFNYFQTQNLKTFSFEQLFYWINLKGNEMTFQIDSMSRVIVEWNETITLLCFSWE